MAFLKEFFEKVVFEKNKQTTKTHTKVPRMQIVEDNILIADIQGDCLHFYNLYLGNQRNILLSFRHRWKAA